MMEASDIIRMNIDRYRTILVRPLADEQCAGIEQLLAEAIHQLGRATDPDAP